MLNLKFPFSKSNIFFKQVSLLAGGTGLAQLINVISLPILSRLYSPVQFGEFTVFFAALTVISAFSTLRYEAAILNEKKYSKAKGSFILTIVSGLFVLFFLSIITMISYIFNLDFFGLSWLYLLLLFINIILFNIFTALYSWCNRQKKYGYLAKGRIYATIFVVTFSIIFGYIDFSGVNGLIIGSLVGMSFNVLFLSKKINLKKMFTKEMSFKYLVKLSIRLKRFPIFLVPATTFDRLANQLHFFVFSSVFGPTVVGAMGMYRNAINLPIRVIGNAFRDVYKREISELLKQDKDCRQVFLKTVLSLFLIGSPIALILFIYAPDIFVLILGKQWLLAGEVASILSLNFLLGFCVSPLTAILDLKYNQKISFLINIVFFIILTIGMIVVSILNDFNLAIRIYAFIFCLKYIFQFLISYNLTKVE